MTAINAWSSDGSSGNRAHLTLPTGKTLRTNLGTAKTLFGAFYLTDTTPGEDGYVYHSRRALNNSENWGLQFRDSSDVMRAIYNAVGVGTSGDTVSGATWMFFVSTHSGTGNDWLTRIISCPAGALLTTVTGTGSSSFDDGQEQNFTFGARYNGTETSQEIRGRFCLMGGITGAQLSEAESLALAADPLNEIDALLATHGSNMWAFDDSGVDISTNAFALTLTGTVSLGSSNGPDIPDRGAPVADGPSINYVSNGSGTTAVIFDTVFEGELFVEISGASFGATQGTGAVYWNTADTLNGNEVQYTGALVWSDTLIRLIGNVDLGAILPGAVYVIVKADSGLIGALQIEVKATPAADAVGVRGIPAPVAIELGQAFSFDASKILFRQDCQEGLSFAASPLPPGISFTSAGVVSGTVSHSAAASYTTEVTGTDPLGASASDQFTWTVLDPDPGTPPGGGGVTLPGVVRGIRIADSSRSIGVA